MTDETKAREIARDIFCTREHMTQEYATAAIATALAEAERRGIERAARQFGPDEKSDCRTVNEETIVATIRALLDTETPAPIPLVLHCPSCGLQHIDEPNPERGWDNPPHRSHECQSCLCVWRPADVATTGVHAVQTKGKADTWTPETPAPDPWCFVKDRHPQPHSVYRVCRDGRMFDATPCYGLHNPWWVPRNGFTRQESEPIDMVDEDRWMPLPTPPGAEP